MKVGSLRESPRVELERLEYLLGCWQGRRGS